MNRLTRRAVSVGLALTAAGAINVAMSSAAPASTPTVKLAYTCNATPAIKVIAGSGGIYNWTMTGTGVCYSANATYGLTMSGAGTSLGAGLCSSATPLVQNFDVVANMTMKRESTGQVLNYTDHFGSPIGVYPVSMPYVVTDNAGGDIGAGVAFTRIFGNCGAAGKDDGAMVWTQVS